MTSEAPTQIAMNRTYTVAGRKGDIVLYKVERLGDMRSNVTITVSVYQS